MGHNQDSGASAGHEPSGQQGQQGHWGQRLTSGVRPSGPPGHQGSGAGPDPPRGCCRRPERVIEWERAMRGWF